MKNFRIPSAISLLISLMSRSSIPIQNRKNYGFIIRRHLTENMPGNDRDYFLPNSGHGDWTHNIKEAYIFKTSKEVEKIFKERESLKFQSYPLEIIIVKL